MNRPPERMRSMNQNELSNLLDELRQLPAETEWVEFKEAKASYSFKELGKYFSALCNEANLAGRPRAWLVFGVRDKDRHIVGSSYRTSRKDLDSLKQEVSAQTTAGITFVEIHELAHSDGRGVLFEIPPAPPGIPVAWQGHFYGRSGESLGALSLAEIETIRGQVHQEDWSAGTCGGATVDDLDPSALANARQNFADKNRGRPLAGEIDEWDDATFLDRARITVKGQVTRTAILLLGKEESAHFLSPAVAQITWKLNAEEQDYQHLGPPFLLNVDRLFSHIRNTRFKIQPFNRLIPVELTKYDPWIVHEALNNCIAHQDYLRQSRIIVTEKADRLILRNAGSFYEGTPEQYVLRSKTPQRYRNPFLAQAMVNLDMIDTMGYGIRKMFLEQRRRFFPMPEYDPNSPRAW